VHQYPGTDENSQVAQVLKGQFEQVGVELNIIAVADFGSKMGYMTSRTTDLILENWTNGTPSPCYIMRYVFYYSDDPNLWQDWLSPVNIGYDEILDEIDNCTGSVEYSDAQMWAAEVAHTIVDESRASIPVLAQYQFWASGPRVESMVPHPVFGHVRWEQIELAD
jgi:ABC-type transport system substrate-binding protein